MPFRFNPSDSMHDINQQWVQYFRNQEQKIHVVRGTNPRTRFDVVQDSFAPHDFQHLAMGFHSARGPWLTRPDQAHEALADIMATRHSISKRERHCIYTGHI
jgi:hypothetical protein